MEECLGAKTQRKLIAGQVSWHEQMGKVSLKLRQKRSCG